MRQDIRQRSCAALRDDELQTNLRQALDHTLNRRADLVAQHPDWAGRRRQARELRDHSLGLLPSLIDQLQTKIRARGGEVSLVADADEARQKVLSLLHQAGARRVVKGKSMVSEEIELNTALERAGIDVDEGDLGELIVQLRGEAPTHITAPALHLNRRQIAELFTHRFDTPLPPDPVALTAAARRFLRQRFVAADAGITGANFLVAESGSLVLVENESNIRLATTLPRLHIAIAGIERLIPRLADLAPLLELLTPSATGQKMTAAVSVLGGARPQNDVDGGCGFHLILVDNGRRQLLADPAMRAALRCIRCGACLNICPVYRRLGGHGFGSVYPGPIGVILSRALLGRRDSAHAFACSLCGACDDICPVEVPLSQLILEVRRRCQTEAGPSVERTGHRAFAGLARRPRLFKAGARLARGALALWPDRLSTSLSADWTDLRALPRPREAQGRAGSTTVDPERES